MGLGALQAPLRDPEMAAFASSSASIWSSFTFARLYASIAWESCESISWIWARTLCASARLEATLGSADADVTEAKQRPRESPSAE